MHFFLAAVHTCVCACEAEGERAILLTCFPFASILVQFSYISSETRNICTYILNVEY